MEAVSRDEIDAFLLPARTWRRDEVLSRPSPVPVKADVYGWWFDEMPVPIDVSNCCRLGDAVLLYTASVPSGRP